MNLHRISVWNETFIYCVGFVCFCSILYVINLLRFNAKMSMLALTLKNSSGQLVGFSVIFFVAFFAFSSYAFLGEKNHSSTKFCVIKTTCKGQTRHEAMKEKIIAFLLFSSQSFIAMTLNNLYLSLSVDLAFNSSLEIYNNVVITFESMFGHLLGKLINN